MLLSILADMPKKAPVSLSLLSKFAYYRRKYGFLHTVCSYIGRNNRPIWNLIGPIVTRRYLGQWLANTEHRILNLGGGSNCLEECLTVDIAPRADAYVDITKKLPFNDSSIDFIFCEEVIEHVDLQLGRNLLKECWRILKPGGILRLATPNLDWFATSVLNSTVSCEEINEVFYNHGHCYLYTQQALQFYCREIGFTNFRKSTYRDPESRLGYLDSHADRFHHPPEISQYLEVQKPDN
jgi:predicted SAM-dependent methyltransferase